MPKQGRTLVSRKTNAKSIEYHEQAVFSKSANCWNFFVFLDKD